MFCCAHADIHFSRCLTSSSSLPSSLLELIRIHVAIVPMHCWCGFSSQYLFTMIVFIVDLYESSFESFQSVSNKV